jgi:ABC-type amino acid transport substrate-binding protein
MNRLLVAFAVAALIAAAGAANRPAGAGTLDKLRQDTTLRIAYRNDAPPFSFLDSTGKPSGFIVDLCRVVARELASELKLSELKIVYVPVTAADRLDAVEKDRADLLCEPTSATLSRREEVDFSIPTFIDGAGMLASGNTPHDYRELAGRNIGVLAGTTTEKTLHNSLEAAGVAADVIPATTHAEGLAMLDDGKISAYFADRSILMSLINSSKDPSRLFLGQFYLTLEPYALAMAKGDEDFRLAVDRALSHIYRSGEIATIFARTFGANVKLGDELVTLYSVSALPD